jgi:hypothetical protein
MADQRSRYRQRGQDPVESFLHRGFDVDGEMSKKKPCQWSGVAVESYVLPGSLAVGMPAAIFMIDLATSSLSVHMFYEPKITGSVPYLCTIYAYASSCVSTRQSFSARKCVLESRIERIPYHRVLSTGSIGPRRLWAVGKARPPITLLVLILQGGS